MKNHRSYGVECGEKAGDKMRLRSKVVERGEVMSRAEWGRLTRGWNVEKKDEW
jgi:hypothetical protein